MMADEVTLAVLREIRDETRATRVELSARIDGVSERLDQAVLRLDRVEGALVELGTQQRFIVRWIKAGARRDRELEGDVRDLKERVSALEERLPPRG
jgi:hypothetical protein